ncbi:MAG: nucleotidyltransferase domain-containing protein [Hyphomicrobiales bacterium]|nr:nucleotidyltransferase domain-containing protein [Hyphomicrobiales bacterium]
MTGLTVNIDSDRVAAAKIAAARRGRSLSSLLRDYIDRLEAEGDGRLPPPLGRVLAALRARRADLEALGVRHLGVFGSVARGAEGPGSDLDLVVDMDPDGHDLLDLAAVAGLVSDLLGTRVDLATRGRLLARLGPDRYHDEVVDAF